MKNRETWPRFFFGAKMSPGVEGTRAANIYI